jgi:diacylglycerol O-acyltransferase 1
VILAAALLCSAFLTTKAKTLARVPAAMTTLVDAAMTTSTKLPDPLPLHSSNGSTTTNEKASKANGYTPSSPKSTLRKYNHVFPIHRSEKASPLSQDAVEAPSFFGFKNLMVLMLIVSNLRLMIENFRKYGVLVCLSCFDFQPQDLYWGSVMYFSVPCHLLIAYIIELIAVQHTKSTLAQLRKEESERNVTSKETAEKSQESFRIEWYTIAAAHTINATLNLVLSTTVVWNRIHHPAIGTLVELHAVIVWLKVCSYALTNRDLRHALLWPDANESLPELYAECPYPRNISLSNLCYFWWAPTLVYQPVYPRTSRIRKSFVFKRILECIGLSIVIWIASAQYAAPLLQNSLEKMASLDFISILERLMKLSTISLFCWLCGFYAFFHSFLNILAEILHFADREFYSDWWNSADIRTYWTSWNKPVYYFMRRHIYAPMVGRGMSATIAQVLVFAFSGLLHELLVGIPTHNVICKLTATFDLMLTSQGLPLPACSSRSHS